MPESRVDSTLEAAKCVFKAPKELRPVLQFHDDGTPLEPQEGSSATSTPPWELLSQREGWLADARSTVALLLELGVAREQVCAAQWSPCAAVVPRWYMRLDFMRPHARCLFGPVHATPPSTVQGEHERPF